VSLAKERRTWKVDAERGRFVNVFLCNSLLLPRALPFPGTILTPRDSPDFRSPSHAGGGTSFEHHREAGTVPRGTLEKAHFRLPPRYRSPLRHNRSRA